MEAALEVSLPVNDGRVKELYRFSIQTIKETRRTRSLPLVLKYYNKTLAAYRSNPAEKDDLLDTISCLAVLESAEAARVLSLQLGLYNSRVAPLTDEDAELVLAIVQALGELRYKASFDSLNYTVSLSYPDIIKEAARNSLNSLKW
jgi:hypothetical protein